MSGWVMFFILLIVGIGMYFTGKCFGVEWTIKHLVEGVPIEGDDENRIVKIAVMFKKDSTKE